MLWLNAAYEQAIRIESPLHHIEALHSLIPFLEIDRRRTTIADMFTALEHGGYDGDADDFRALALRTHIAQAVRYVPQHPDFRHACPSPALLRNAIQLANRVITDQSTRAEIIQIFDKLLYEPALYGTPIS